VSVREHVAEHVERHGERRAVRRAAHHSLHTGRRPGESGTRAAILDAARQEFGGVGFDRATIRGIAALAGVDPALVHHYFGTKDELFDAALQLPVRADEIVPQVLAGDPDGLGERAVRTLLAIWEDEQRQTVFRAMIRSAASNEQAAAMIREIITRQIIGPIAHALAMPNAELRANLVGSQIMGLMMVRFITKLEPLASATVDEVVAAVAPTIQRYLVGEITG
jgi:AcrR family transcriptional regulator